MVFLRLRAKTGDDVGGDGAVGHQFADLGDALKIPCGGVAPAHLLEDAVGAGLHGQMDVPADVGMRGHRLQHLVGDILRVGRREADPQLRTDPGDHLQELGERNAFEVVRIDVLPEQSHLTVAAPEAVAGLADDGPGVAAALHTAGVRHDAVGADVVAPAHDRDECGHSALVYADGIDVGVSLFAREDYVYLGMAFGCGLEQFGKAPVGVGAGHEVDPAIGQELFLHTLSHASEDADYHRTGLALKHELADAAEDPLLGVVADRAGVGHYHVGLVDRLRAHIAMGSEYRENHLRVGYVHLAAVSFYIYLFHYRPQR